MLLLKINCSNVFSNGSVNKIIKDIALQSCKVGNVWPDQKYEKTLSLFPLKYLSTVEIETYVYSLHLLPSDLVKHCMHNALPHSFIPYE